MRDHGGNLDWAMNRWGGGFDDWVDLSTGINPVAYPMPEISKRAWAVLPTSADISALIKVAKTYFKTDSDILPVAGATAAIQMVPMLESPDVMRVLGPTYNEHAASFSAAGWRVEQVSDLDKMAGAKAAVVVNPNNPDGRRWTPGALRSLAGEVGTLVVDESFVDPEDGLSMTDEIPGNALILRSFGKFFGLAGLRLGFVLGGRAQVSALAAKAGPWPVSGPAIEVGCRALGDVTWQAQTTARLAKDAARLDELATLAGWEMVGGTTLFRLYRTPDAKATQEVLARAKVWGRVFPYADDWLRLGLPGPAQWGQVGDAIRSAGKRE